MSNIDLSFPTNSKTMNLAAATKMMNSSSDMTSSSDSSFTCLDCQKESMQKIKQRFNTIRMDIAMKSRGVRIYESDDESRASRAKLEQTKKKFSQKLAIVKEERRELRDERVDALRQIKRLKEKEFTLRCAYTKLEVKQSFFFKWS